jgi:hypothetical protein
VETSLRNVFKFGMNSVITATSRSSAKNWKRFAAISPSARAKELIQAHRADFIIVLYSSPGSIAEVHDFGGFLKELGSKMLVFVDSRHVKGYGYSGLLSELKADFNNVHEFTYPEDITECHLMGAVDDKLGRLRTAKWWAAKTGRPL